MTTSFSTTLSDWQGVDDKPTAGSNNLVKSGGVAEKLTELEGKVKDLTGYNDKNIDLSKYEEHQGAAGSDGIWRSYLSENYRHIAIPVDGLPNIEIIANSIYRTRCLFLTDYSVPSASETVVHIVPGETEIIVNAGQSSDIIAVPQNAKYLYVETHAGAYDCKPSSITIKGTKGEVSILKEQVGKIGSGKEIINLSLYSEFNGIASPDATWIAYSSDNYKHKVIPIEEGRELFIVGSNAYQTVFSFLKSYHIPDAEHTNVDFVDGWNVEPIDVGGVRNVTIPDGSKFLYIETHRGNYDNFPLYVEYENSGYIKDIFNSIDKLLWHKEIDLSIYDKNIITSEITNLYGWWLTDGGTWNAGGDNSCKIIPTDGAIKLNVRGEGVVVGLLKSTKASIRAMADFCYGYNSLVFVDGVEEIYLPKDCKYVYVRGLQNGVNKLPNYFSFSYIGNCQKTPIFTFVDDDSRAEQMEWLEPIVQETGVPISIALITEAVGADGYCTWEQLRRYRNEGFNFVAHSSQNITTLDLNVLEERFQNTQRDMESHGMLDSNIFVLPNGGINDATRALLKRYFTCSFSTRPRINVDKVIDKYFIDRVSLDEGASSFSAWKDFVNKTIMTNGWCIFYGHARDSAYDDAMRTAYKELISYIKASGGRIMSLPDAYKYFGVT